MNKDEKKRFLLIGIGIVVACFTIAFWYISIPIIGIYLYLRYRKKKYKSYLPPTDLVGAVKYDRLNSGYIAYLEGKVKEDHSRRVKTRHAKKRTCEACGEIIRYLSTVSCPYCGSPLPLG